MYVLRMSLHLCDELNSHKQVHKMHLSTRKPDFEQQSMQPTKTQTSLLTRPFVIHSLDSILAKQATCKVSVI